MQINFSTVSRIAYLIFVLVFLYGLATVTYGWSLNETERFSVLIVGPRYAFWLSVVIQVGQQPVLILRELIKDLRVRKLLTGLFFLLAGVDAITNIGAFIQQFSAANTAGFTPVVIQMAYLIGLIFCVAIVFADEFEIWLLGGVFYLLGLVLADFGWKSPKWFNLKAAMKATQTASGASAASIPSPQDLLDSDRGRPGNGESQWAGRGDGRRQPMS